MLKAKQFKNKGSRIFKTKDDVTEHQIQESLFEIETDVYTADILQWLAGNAICAKRI